MQPPPGRGRGNRQAWLRAAGHIRQCSGTGELGSLQAAVAQAEDGFGEGEVAAMLGAAGTIQRECYGIDGRSRGVFECGVTGVFVTEDTGYDSTMNRFKTVRLDAGIGGRYGKCGRDATALHFAVVDQHWSCVEYLLSLGADLHLPAACGVSPWDMARTNRTVQHLEAIAEHKRTSEDLERMTYAAQTTRKPLTTASTAPHRTQKVMIADAADVDSDGTASTCSSGAGRRLHDEPSRAVPQHGMTFSRLRKTASVPAGAGFRAAGSGSGVLRRSRTSGVGVPPSVATWVDETAGAGGGGAAAAIAALQEDIGRTLSGLAGNGAVPLHPPPEAEDDEHEDDLGHPLGRTIYDPELEVQLREARLMQKHGPRLTSARLKHAARPHGRRPRGRDPPPATARPLGALTQQLDDRPPQLHARHRRSSHGAAKGKAAARRRPHPPAAPKKTAAPRGDSTAAPVPFMSLWQPPAQRAPPPGVEGRAWDEVVQASTKDVLAKAVARMQAPGR